MRKRQGLFIVEGIKSVADTIDFFELEAIVKLKELTEPVSLVLPENSVFEVDRQMISKISSLTNPPEILAVYKIPPEPSVDDIDSSELYLMLSGIQDPGNLGTIVRTAHWFGIKRIFASYDTVDIYNPKSIQSTMGSFGKVEICYCDLKQLISSHPDMPVYGTLLEGDNIYDSHPENRGFIIMGNEGKGIPEDLHRLLTHALFIPPYNSKDHSESLNVGVATGIVLSQFRMRSSGPMK